MDLKVLKDGRTAVTRLVWSMFFIIPVPNQGDTLVELQRSIILSITVVSSCFFASIVQSFPFYN